jgi:NAD(P)-dependent dehydrogenase (short-subunit alcohol dehydrogenase family)
MDTFDKKNILIVGSSSGIGQALAKDLSSSKAYIYTASRNKPDPTSAVATKHISVDVLNLNSELDELPDTIHGLVYCPGTINLKPFRSLKEEDFQNDFNLNVIGAVKVIQACLNQLKNAKGASIVLFSTVAVKTGMSYHASIAAAKGALEGLGRSLAAELASKNIRVNLIALSLTDTPLAENLLNTEGKRESSNKRHPLGRVGNPKEIASMARFLLSEDSNWITGQVIGVDGGISTLKPL